MMAELILSVESVGLFIAVVVLGLFGLLMPLSAYSAQQWASRNDQEIEKLHRKCDEFLVLMRARNRNEP
jgi:hypothetical protein